MADVVLGIGSSHTPQLSSGAGVWSQHAERDRRNPGLLDADGEVRTYDELAACAPAGVASELTPEVFDAKWTRVQDAVAELSRRLAEAEPDVVVVVGDDQRELFGDEGFPAIGLFLGDELWDRPPDGEHLATLAKRAPDILPALWASHAEAPEPYPVAAALSQHLADALTAAEFDLTVLRRQPEGCSLGHAFTFVRRRLGLAPGIPIVPVLLNTYYPPNVPSPQRCYALGRALRAGLASWSGHERVAVVASGGLSHFVVLEDLDRKVLAGLQAHDAAALGAVPPRVLRSGTSEILNWVTVGGMVEDLDMSVVDYVAGYRSPAGTGCGMAFAVWGGEG